MGMGGRVGVRRLGRRSYRQARVPAKILLFSIASVHGGLNITPSERTSSGSPWIVGTGGWVGCWTVGVDRVGMEQRKTNRRGRDD